MDIQVFTYSKITITQWWDDDDDADKLLQLKTFSWTANSCNKLKHLSAFPQNATVVGSFCQNSQNCSHPDDPVETQIQI